MLLASLRTGITTETAGKLDKELLMHTCVSSSAASVHLLIQFLSCSSGTDGHVLGSLHIGVQHSRGHACPLHRNIVIKRKNAWNSPARRGRCTYSRLWLSWRASSSKRRANSKQAMPQRMLTPVPNLGELSKQLAGNARQA